MTRADEPKPPAGAGDAPGLGLRKASWWGTGIFSATALAASVVGGLGSNDALTRVVEAVAFAVAVGLFLAGCVLFLAAYARGVARSRTDEVAVTNLFFLPGGVPSGVRRSLFGSLAVQVIMALGTAIARPYTSLAAGALVPMYGLGLCGLWSARHGTFAPRKSPARPPKSAPRTKDRPDEKPGSVNGS